MSGSMSFVTKFSLLALVAAGIVGCTSARNEAGLPSANDSSAKAVGSAKCSSDDVASFEKSEGTLVDLEREEIPKGLYLAAQSTLLVEKKFDGATGAARFMVREEPGKSEAKVICAENPERLGPEMQTAVAAVVKFDTSVSNQSRGLTTRQFLAFVGKNGYGVVLSTAKNEAAIDLKTALANSNAVTQIFKLSERSFAIRYFRERDGVKTRVLTRFDLVNFRG